MKSNADFLFTFAYFHYSIGKRKQAKVKRKLTFGFIRIVDYTFDKYGEKSINNKEPDICLLEYRV